MDSLIIKPSLKIVKLIGKLERNIGFNSSSNQDLNLINKTINSTLNLLTNLKLDSELESQKILDAHNQNFLLSKINLLELGDFGQKIREDKYIFCDLYNRPLFSSVSPFVLETRLEELIRWTNLELNSEKIHPAIICAVYHLTSLHLQAFKDLSHTITLISSWHLLKDYVFKDFKQIDLSSFFLKRSDYYFTSIKQAEKSCFSNWHSINFWLEFYLETLIDALENNSELKNKSSRIKPNLKQQKILDYIENTGLAKREEIVSKTGINIATVKYSLNVLTQRGDLKRSGKGKASSYSLNKLETK